MTNPYIILILAVTALAATIIAAVAGLKGWNSWLQFKHSELARDQHSMHETPQLGAASRIEIADLKERVRKLEAIAAGVDL